MGDGKQIKQMVNQSELIWNSEKGIFYYDGEEVVLFWIESAFKSLLDAIEEVSGVDSATVVLETAGYRMGVIVASYYQQMGDLEQVLERLPSTYGAAGWGKFSVPHFDAKEKRATVRLENSWEHLVNKAQEKKQPGAFLPGHWAGVFTGLFGTNMWYKIVKSQLLGDEYDEVVLEPTDISPEQNIHDFIRQKEKRKILDLERSVKQRTEELDELIQDLSVPVIPVLEKIIVIPLIAKYDDRRAEELMQKAMYGLKEYEAEYLLLDLTGLKQVSDETIHLLHKLVQAVGLLGGTAVLVGISPEISTGIVRGGYDTTGIISFSTLQHGIYFALAQMDMQIIKKR